MVIRQDGQKITGVDGSGTAVLVGTRKRTAIKFKLSYRQASSRELEGELIVDNDGLNVSGTWRDPVSNASGEWKLMKIQHESRIDRLTNMENHFQEFISRRVEIEVNINYEIIKSINVWEEHLNWKTVCGIYSAVIYESE